MHRFRSFRRPISSYLGVLVALLAAVPASAAPKKKGDLVATHPDYATFGIASIALLPAASYDHNASNEKLVEGIVGQALRPTGYRWVSPSLSKDMLRSAFGGDSALRLVRGSVIAQGRVDSLAAPALCAALRVDALLTLRIDLFEKVEMEFNQAGRPSTTVQLRAAMVDSLGRVAWSASGSETMEGIYHDPESATIGIKGSGLSNQPLTGQGGAPRYEDVVSKLLVRWMPKFPAKTVPVATP
jgi:hypothetical protein